MADTDVHTPLSVPEEDENLAGETRTNAEATQNTTTEYWAPTELWNLVCYDVCVNDSVEVVTETCRLLGDMGIDTPGRLHDAPDDLIRAALPFSTRGRHYMCATHVKKTQASWYTDPSSNQVLAAAMLKMAKETRATRKASSKKEA